MATVGAHIFNGYIHGRGPVQVFQDVDNPKAVFALMRNGQYLYTTRERIKVRKLSAKRAEKMK